MYCWLEHFDDEIAVAANSAGDDDDDDDEMFDEQDIDALDKQSLAARRTRLLYNEQSAHSALTGYKAYAVSSSDFSFLARDTLANFRLCSLEWHLFLQ